ncbi:hypothetical protein U9R90_27065 [Streptomyces sp. E11-3]|uniref:hypothetical protein n=1 Tax=Streptomyces sp. E11-3 TaxID=3110112 RepID=UPI00397F27F4
MWVSQDHRELIAIEQNTAPDHQLVILGHELWHMREGQCRHATGGRARAAARFLAEEADLQEVVLKFAARAHTDDDEEVDAEAFGRRLGAKCRAWLPGGSARSVRRDVPEGRIEVSLGYRPGR